MSSNRNSGSMNEEEDKTNSRAHLKSKNIDRHTTKWKRQERQLFRFYESENRNNKTAKTMNKKKSSSK